MTGVNPMPCWEFGRAGRTRWGTALFEVSRVVRPTATVFYPVSAALAGRGDWHHLEQTTGGVAR